MTAIFSGVLLFVLFATITLCLLRSACPNLVYQGVLLVLELLFHGSDKKDALAHRADFCMITLCIFYRAMNHNHKLRWLNVGHFIHIYFLKLLIIFLSLPFLFFRLQVNLFVFYFFNHVFIFRKFILI